MREIPIEAAKYIAKDYGYDQVVIFARKVGEGEHMTTYGTNEEHCGIAARMGETLKRFMGWRPTISAARHQAAQAETWTQEEIDRAKAEGARLAQEMQWEGVGGC